MGGIGLACCTGGAGAAPGLDVCSPSRPVISLLDWAGHFVFTQVTSQVTSQRATVQLCKDFLSKG